MSEDELSQHRKFESLPRGHVSGEGVDLVDLAGAHRVVDVTRDGVEEPETSFRGDQIGRIFDYWAMVYLRQVVLIFSYFLRCFDQNGLGYILGDALANSSGHPAH
jgi:hypothetical protein